MCVGWAGQGSQVGGSGCVIKTQGHPHLKQQQQQEMGAPRPPRSTRAPCPARRTCLAAAALQHRSAVLICCYLVGQALCLLLHLLIVLPDESLDGVKGVAGVQRRLPVPRQGTLEL